MPHAYSVWVQHGLYIYIPHTGAICCLLPDTFMKIVQVFIRWVISLKRFRLFSQKVVSESPVRDAFQRDMGKDRSFF